jgi:hypothetical protein
VFNIMRAIIYETIEAVYHNVGNEILKLFSFKFVSKNPQNGFFTKRLRSELFI